MLAMLILVECANAQRDWHAVESLQLGTPISVRASNSNLLALRHADCDFVSASDTELACNYYTSSRGHRYGPFVIRFNRWSISRIRIERPGDSEIAGAAVGAGAFAAVGASASDSGNRGDAALLGGLLGGALGAAVGHVTSFLHGPIIYQK
jgi:hypothetical protein